MAQPVCWDANGFSSFPPAAPATNTRDHSRTARLAPPPPVPDTGLRTYWRKRLERQPPVRMREDAVGPHHWQSYTSAPNLHPPESPSVNAPPRSKGQNLPC